MLGSDKQIGKWIPLATHYQLIGSYAQTELGHGKAARKTQRFHGTKGSGPASQGNLSSRCPCFTGAGVAAGEEATCVLEVDILSVPPQAGGALALVLPMWKNNKSEGESPRSHSRQSPWVEGIGQAACPSRWLSP